MPSLWPREHGAIVQLAFPLVSACALTQGAGASLALSFAAALAFLAHEPLLLLSGARGAKKRELARGPALRRLVSLVSLSALGVGGALWLAPTASWPSTLLPLVLGVCALGLALRGRERNVGAEVFVAITLATTALPVAMMGGATFVAGASLSAVWGVGFGVATVAARALVIQKKDAGRGLRLALGAATLAALALFGAAALRLAPLSVALAPVPLLALAVVLAVFPPSPKRMTTVGIGMTVASLATFALAVHGLGWTN